jgi:pectin methylesterase-like acyl-CoA thioesterase
MKRASLLTTFLIVFSVFHIAVTIIPDNAMAITRYVGGTGPGNFTTIQSAIDASNNGDTVYVYNGTYSEHLIINKTLSLVGEHRDTTNIQLGESDRVQYIRKWTGLW